MRFNVKMRLDGVLLVDKPVDVTSHDVVQRVRRILGTREVGHCGTLDPLASGLLVLLLGQGTKLSDYLLNQNKVYQLKMRLGVRTDTLDRMGQILKQEPVEVSAEKFSEEILKAQGSLHLEVPAYSAVKIEGKKLYEYARQGEVVESPRREMKFWDLKILELSGEYAEVQMCCSKGSYVRAWTAFVGEQLGCGAVLEELRRLRSEPFGVESTITTAKMEGFTEVVGSGQSSWPEVLGSAYLSLTQALPHWRSINLDSRDEKILMNGQVSQDLFNRLIVDQKQVNLNQQTLPLKAISATSGRLLALLELQPNFGPKIRRVFPRS